MGGGGDGASLGASGGVRVGRGRVRALLGWVRLAG